jgi:hypothetical protein
VDPDTWRFVLVTALAVNATLGFGYRVFRLARGGPLGDVIGQAVLGVLLVSMALAIGLGVEWVRWVALAYALVFGLAVMPVWVLAVLMPLVPRPPDYAFTAAYWLALGVIAVAAVAS